MESKIIFHIDINQFFVAVELLNKPDLIGKPVVVSSNSKKSIISSASYEARELGISAGMPVFKIPEHIRRKITFLNLNFRKYSFISKTIFSYLKGNITTKISQASVDECYLDVTDIVGNSKLKAWDLAKTIQKTIYKRFKMNINIGIANTLLLAKISSNQKTSGRIFTLYNFELFKFYKMQVKEFHFIGAKTVAKLKTFNIFTINDLRLAVKQNNVEVKEVFGKKIYWLIDALNGKTSNFVDNRLREPKSFSSDTTLIVPTDNFVEIEKLTERLLLKNLMRLKRYEKKARTIHVAIGYKPYKKFSKQLTLKNNTDNVFELLKTAKSLIEKLWDNESKIRFISVGLNNFENARSVIQISWNEVLPDFLKELRF